MSDDDSKNIDAVAALVSEMMQRASKRRAAQADDIRSLEERIAAAREAGLLADETDLRRLQELLADAHLILYRLVGSLGEGLTEPTLELRLRAALIPGYLRQLAQGAEAAVSYAYQHVGGMDQFMADRAEHAATSRELQVQACTCDACLIARAAGRETYQHTNRG